MASLSTGTDPSVVQPISGSVSSPPTPESGHTSNPDPKPPLLGSLGDTPRRLNSNKGFTNKGPDTGRKLAAEDMEKRSTYVTYEVFMSDCASASAISAQEPSTPLPGEYLLQESELKTKEIPMYSKILDGMQPILKEGGLVGRITARHFSVTSTTGIVGDNKPYDLAVDLSIFESSGSVPGGLISECDLSKEEQDNSKSGPKHLLARSDWDKILVPIEIKPQSKSCAFNPPEAKLPLPEAGTIDGEKTRGQTSQYASMILGRQHRKHLYSIYIHGKWVYLIRWDRVGAVIAERFDLLKEPHKLQNFLYRLTKMTPAERGYDTSIRVADEAEKEEFKALQDVDSAHQSYVRDALRKDGDKEAAIFRVDLQAKDPEKPVKLVFARPRVLGEGVVGRATRGYVAYDLGEKRLVFLKDYWQPETKSYHPELDTYTRLQAKNVPYIATPVGGGYVYDDSSRSEESLQKTVAQKYLPMVHGQSYCARAHYRFAVEEIGRPLEDYRDAKEMVRAVYLAVIAHRIAWEDAGVLHRDISSGNILITKDGKGLLNDWDMCKYVDEVANLQSPAFRSGTWPFMSALLLRCPKKPHQLSDDVESFVHVINWLTLRFQVSSTSDGIDCSLKMYEECRRTKEGFDVGGSIKLDYIKGGTPGFIFEKVQPPALRAVVQQLWAMCREHYSSPEVMEALKDIDDSELKPEPLALYPSPEEHVDDELPAPRCAFQCPLETAPVGEKPLMGDHLRIEGILYAILKGSTDRTRWQGVKFGDQFLKRSTKRTLTAPGGSAKLHGSVTSQRPSQGMRMSQNVSNPRSRRSVAVVEDPEVQGNSKRAKRNNAGRPPRVMERDEEGGDAGPGKDVDPFIA